MTFEDFMAKLNEKLAKPLEEVVFDSPQEEKIFKKVRAGVDKRAAYVEGIQKTNQKLAELQKEIVMIDGGLRDLAELLYELQKDDTPEKEVVEASE